LDYRKKTKNQTLQLAEYQNFFSLQEKK